MTISLRDKVHRRAGHVCFQFNDLLYIWGGLVEHISKKPRYPNTIPKNSNDLHSADELFAYDPVGRTWSRIVATGEVPPRTYGAASCVVQKSLYVFGGHHCYENDPGYFEGNNNLLFELQLSEMRWTRLHTRGKPPLPAEKSVMFAHDDSLYVLGGYGEEPPESSEVSFELNPASPHSWPRGWNGVLSRLCLSSKQWKEIRPKGSVPSPRAGHTGVVLRDMFFLFGGSSARSRLDDTHVLDLATASWSKLAVLGPEARSLHSLTPVDANRAVLYGGLSATCQPLNDAWVLDVLDPAHLSWTEVALPYDHGEVRCWHGACCTADGQLLVHSGLTQEYYLNRVQLDDHPEAVLALDFGVRSLFRASFEACLSFHHMYSEEAVGMLPEFLRRMLASRLDEPFVYHECNPPAEDPFDRTMIHEGS